MQPTDTRVNVVRQSHNYDQFSFLGNNRNVNRGHVEALKEQFAERGNLTRIQPILVNDNFEIIDGQHRFTACQELGEPIYYTIGDGLGISDARQMNIHHRRWNVDDYAQSYAASGDTSYIKFLELKEDYGYNHSITLAYALGANSPGIYADFRNGDFVLENEAAARTRLQQLKEAYELLPQINGDTRFAHAFLNVMNAEVYDRDRMLRKLQSHGAAHMRIYGTVNEYMRALEDIYNLNMVRRSRLY